tara:strand:- start:521 stop:757 length:237 start_codon:yes stop_codon:yes gene_type:complete
MKNKSIKSILHWLFGWLLAALIIVLLVFGFAKLSAKVNAQDPIIDCSGAKTSVDWMSYGFCGGSSEKNNNNRTALCYI